MCAEKHGSVCWFRTGLKRIDPCRLWLFRTQTIDTAARSAAISLQLYEPTACRSPEVKLCSSSAICWLNPEDQEPG